MNIQSNRPATSLRRRMVEDMAARKLASEGVGKMFCLAGVGGRVSMAEGAGPAQSTRRTTRCSSKAGTGSQRCSAGIYHNRLTETHSDAQTGSLLLRTHGRVRIWRFGPRLCWQYRDDDIPRRPERWRRMRTDSGHPRSHSCSALTHEDLCYLALRASCVHVAHP